METTSTKGLRLTAAYPYHAANYLVRAAITAPSLHNSQPWLFIGDRTCLDLYANPARQLPAADPDGRELVIGCGAALFNVRLAMRHLGFRPDVRVCPTRWNPAHLARIGWGPFGRAGANEELMHHALRARRTHRGPFQSPPLPQRLVDDLRRQARAEGADLYVVTDGNVRGHLAELVREAETIQRTDPAWRAELYHWTQEFTGTRLDGVPLATCTYHPDCVPFAGRDFLGLSATMPDPPEVWSEHTGLVAVLTTCYDTRVEWLQAGQALQRLLLHAAAHRVSAAFHTQPLELPRLRAQVRAGLLFGQFPQMILRLGHTRRGAPTPRRPATDVLRMRSESGGGATRLGTPRR